MYAPIHPIAGAQPISGWFEPDTTQRFPLGMKLDAVDPFWGYGSFVYGKSAAALNYANVVVMQAALFGSFDKVPNTANLGQPVLLTMNEMAISEFGWFQKAGVGVAKFNATVAAAASVGITAAGILGAFAAGKQIVGYSQLKSATATLTPTANTQTGSAAIKIPAGYDGLFLGAALSGAGIPASTVVARLDPDGITIYTGSAIGTVGDKNATATGQITLTATFTGYSVGHIESPFAQGQIT